MGIDLRRQLLKVKGGSGGRRSDGSAGSDDSRSGTANNVLCEYTCVRICSG